MTRRYYSSRNKPRNLTLEELYQKLQHLYFLFRDKDFFREKAGVTQSFLPEAIKHEAALELSFQPFPIEKWSQESITEDRIFDTLEFLYDRVSAPNGEMVWVTDVVHPLNGTQSKNKINCAQEGVQDGPHEKEL